MAAPLRATRTMCCTMGFLARLQPVAGLERITATDAVRSTRPTTRGIPPELGLLEARDEVALIERSHPVDSRESRDRWARHHRPLPSGTNGRSGRCCRAPRASSDVASTACAHS
jgi:hypothetical protein